MGVGTYALITLAEARVHPDIPATGNDTLIETLIDACTAIIEEQTRRKLKSRDHTEYYDGTGIDTLWLRNYPWSAITHLYDDTDRDWDSNDEIDVADDVINSQDNKDCGKVQLWNNESAFSTGVSAIKIEYTAGYTPVPNDLKWACVELVADMYKRPSSRVKSEKIGAYAITYSDGSFPRGVSETLAKYRRPLI